MVDTATNTNNKENLSKIADEILTKAGFDLQGNAKSSINCKFISICKRHYDISKCNYEANNCILLKNIKQQTLTTGIFTDISNKLKIPEELNNPKMTGLDIPIVCPRSMKSKIFVNSRCRNSKCHFYTPKMGFSCILLHNQTFFPDSNIPKRVIEVSTGLSNRILERYNKLAIYYMRIYLIILKYSLENLKIDYSLLFKTKYVKEFFHYYAPETGNIIECCPICGAYTPNYKEIRKRIKNAKYEEFFEKHTTCDCNIDSIFEKRKLYNQNWQKLLTKERYPDKQSFTKMNYKDFYLEYKNDFFSRSLIIHLISQININNLYLKDIPLGFVLKSYKIMYGNFDSYNLGLEEHIGSKLFRYFGGSNA